jgi:hypothetical protein
MKIILDALLPLLMPVAILGGVFSGLCTATEAAVVAVVYALFLAVFVYRELTLKDFFKVSADAVVSTGVIMLIISVASPFGWLMSTQKVPQMFASWLMSIFVLSFVDNGKLWGGAEEYKRRQKNKPKDRFGHSNRSRSACTLPPCAEHSSREEKHPYTIYDKNWVKVRVET